MQHFYRDTNNHVHALEDIAFDYLLPVGCVQISEQEALSLLQPERTPEEIIAEKIAAIDIAIKQRLDIKAQSMGFDTIASALISAALPIGEYKQAEGAALLLWSARTWQKAAEIRDAYIAGTRPEPTWDEVESELPSYPIE
jgi:hypothetical protein